MMRTKEFDLETTLDKAMYTFWQQGYSGTSMQNLVDAMGINRRSIYDTYGDKDALFLKALDRYIQVVTRDINEKLTSTMSLQEELTVVFDHYIDHANQPDGCLLVNSATELANNQIDQQRVSQYLGQERGQIEQLLQAAQSELAVNTAIADLAVVIQNALIGVRVLARAKTPKSQLRLIMTRTIQSLPWRKQA